MSIEDEGQVNHHWNYFLALENDTEVLSRYVQFHKDNFKMYSIELVRLLFSASSEFEIVAKATCEVLEHGSNPGNISDIRTILFRHYPEIARENVFIPHYGLRIDTPFENFARGISPNWWGSYNAVKHARHTDFDQATLWNALLALGGLFIICLYHQKAQNPHSPMRDLVHGLKPFPKLFRFQEPYYANPVFVP